MQDDRAIAWTLDALLMVAVMTGGVIYAINTAPTGASEEAATNLAEAQLQSDAGDVLLVANATGNLTASTVHWNASRGAWYNSDKSGFYTTPPPKHPLQTPLADVLQQTGVAYDIAVVYQDAGYDTHTYRMFYQGTPGAHGVVASHTIILYDDTKLDWPGHDTTLGAVNSSSSQTFYAPDAFPDGPKFNIVQVRVIAWQY